MTYHPTTKVLAVLELLQTHGELSGPEIARRLEIGERSVRRYITTLQDLGVPVESARGRYGTYRLRPSYKLPPLTFSENEALVISFGLQLIRRSGLVGSAHDAEAALAKLERALPDALRERGRAMQTMVALDISPLDVQTEGRFVGRLSEAAYLRQRVRLRYQAFQAEATEREVDPYGVAWQNGRWYVVGYCHLRQDIRLFRVDRIAAVEPCDQTFERPADFDVRAYVTHALATAPIGVAVEVLLETPLSHVRSLPVPLVGTFEEVSGGVMLRSQAYAPEHLASLAHFLIGLDCPLIVRNPPELRAELERIARHTATLVARGAE